MQPTEVNDYSILLLTSDRIETILVPTIESCDVNIELIPGLSNVIRFPVEDRVEPSMDLLNEIGPDPREVLAVAESFHLEAIDPDLQDATDAETARHIAEQILPLKLDATALKLRLAALLDPVVIEAVRACRTHRKKAKVALEAQELALKAKTESGFWLPPLEEEADALTMETAKLFLEAATRLRIASGVSRAVGFARRGEPWVPYDPVQDTKEWLAQLDKLPPRPRA